MIFITARHMNPSTSTQHQHIAAVRWRDAVDGSTGSMTREQAVAWIRKGGDARVQDGTRSVVVGVVEGTPPYLRTHANGVYTDNLLSLPTY